jgi:hypothetical protein
LSTLIRDRSAGSKTILSIGLCNRYDIRRGMGTQTLPYSNAWTSAAF